jgi:hypothetical protein
MAPLPSAAWRDGKSISHATRQCLGVALLALTVASCEQAFGPRVECAGYYDSTDCADHAEEIIATWRDEEPAKTIVELRFTANGGYQVTFSDGTTKSGSVF